MLRDLSIALTVFLPVFLFLCNFTGALEDACNDTVLRLVNGSDLNSSAPNISENSSSTWMPTGRVEVCWGGEWRGLLHGSIRTTRQLELICQEVGFLPEGAEICEGAHDENYTDLVHCWLDVAEDNLTVHNCSNATSLQQTCNMASNFVNLDTAAVIKCKTLSEFSPQDIALMVLCPLLASLTFVGVIIFIHYVRKVKRLNVIIHQLIYKQQKIKAGIDGTGLESAVRNSMYGYAKPSINGTTGRENNIDSSRGPAAEGERRGTDNASSSLAGPGQYSLLGNDKYENVNLNEIQQAP